MRILPASHDLTLYQGAAFELALSFRDAATGDPLDLSGRTGRMHIRAAMEDPDPLVDLTTQNGRIAIDGPEGRVTLRLTAEVTAALPLPAGGVFDLELVALDGGVDRVLMGRVRLDPEVTR